MLVPRRVHFLPVAKCQATVETGNVILVSCNGEPFFYISLGFWKNSFFTCNKPILVLKVLTAMEEPSVAQALSRLVSGGRRRIKRMYWSIACGELQIQWAVPLGKAVLSYHVFKYFEFVFVKEH